MARITKSIRVEPDLHAQIKGFAGANGINLDDAYELAIRSLVNPAAEDPWKLSHHERTLVDAFVRLVRSKEEMSEMILSGVKIWMKSNPPVQTEKRKAS